MNELLHFAKTELNNPLIHAFVWSVIADIITGVSKGIFLKSQNKISSQKGLPGLIKHAVVLFIVLSIYPFLAELGYLSIAQALTVSYLGIYGVSILENLGQMGVPIPEFIKSRLEKLNKKGK